MVTSSLERLHTHTRTQTHPHIQIQSIFYKKNVVKTNAFFKKQIRYVSFFVVKRIMTTEYILFYL